MKKYFASGVFKLDVAHASYEDVKSVAKRWAEDTCFHELIVRKVSEHDYGIQFAYIAEGDSHKTLTDFENELTELFSRIKAIDACERTTNDDLENIFEDVIVLRNLR